MRTYTMKTMNLIAAIMTLTLMPALALADWTLPLSIAAGTAQTTLTIGIATGASDGYDPGQDVPTLTDSEVLNASFPHPTWGVVIAGSAVTSFHRDIRGNLPQQFAMEITSTVSPLTISWNRTFIGTGLGLVLRDESNGAETDMAKSDSYTLATVGNPAKLSIYATDLNNPPPATPTGLHYEIKGTSIYLAWNANMETSLAGYVLALENELGTTIRTVNLKTITNYNLMDVAIDTPYTISLKAFDSSGNMSGAAEITAAIRVTPTCTGGLVLVGNSCTCPAGTTLVNGSCQSIPTCSGGQLLVNNTCQCPTGTTLINSTCQIPATTTTVPETPASTTEPASITSTPTTASPASVSTTTATTATVTSSTTTASSTPTNTSTVAADGDLDGDGLVSIKDALKSLRVVVGLDQLTPELLKHADVAPLINGKPAPDGVVSIADVLLILRRATGLITW